MPVPAQKSSLPCLRLPAGAPLGDIRGPRFHTREQQPWESKEYPHPMIHPQSGRQAEEFATQCRGWLLAQARNVSRNASDAEDLVQETLLRFIQKGEAKALPGEEHWEGWLVKTLSNLFMDQCRRRKVQERGAADPSLNAEAPVLQGPSAPSVYDTLTDEQFEHAVGETLSPMLRDTLMMHMAGKRMAEIGRTLGIPEGTVRKRLHDSRVKLREFLQQYIPPGDH
jgi:RNA polymerase sigma-70 factor, ECF subfamily